MNPKSKEVLKIICGAIVMVILIGVDYQVDPMPLYQIIIVWAMMGSAVVVILISAWNYSKISKKELEEDDTPLGNEKDAGYY